MRATVVLVCALIASGCATNGSHRQPAVYYSAALGVNLSDNTDAPTVRLVEALNGRRLTECLANCWHGIVSRDAEASDRPTFSIRLAFKPDQDHFIVLQPDVVRSCDREAVRACVVELSREVRERIAPRGGG